MYLGWNLALFLPLVAERQDMSIDIRTGFSLEPTVRVVVVGAVATGEPHRIGEGDVGV